MPKIYVFRAIGLPAGTTLETLKGALAQYLQAGEKLDLVDWNIVPSCPRRRDGSVTVIFGVSRCPEMPGFLEQLLTTPEDTFDFELEDNCVELDLHFLGFTQMYGTPEDEPIVAE